MLQTLRLAHSHTDGHSNVSSFAYWWS